MQALADDSSPAESAELLGKWKEWAHAVIDATVAEYKENLRVQS